MCALDGTDERGLRFGVEPNQWSSKNISITPYPSNAGKCVLLTSTAWVVSTATHRLL